MRIKVVDKTSFLQDSRYVVKKQKKLMKDVKRLKKAGLLFCQKPVKIDETVSLIQFKHENGGVLEYSTDSSNEDSLINEILLPKILTSNPITSEYSFTKLSELSKWFLGEDQGIFSDWENSFIFALDSVYTLSTQHITESVISGNLEFTMPLRIFKILKVLQIKTFQVTIYGGTVFLYGNNGQLKLTYQNCFDKLIKLTQSAKNSFDDLKKTATETNISFSYLKKDIDKIKSVSDTNIVDLTKENSFLNLPMVADIRYLRILAGNNKKVKLKSLSYETGSYSYHYYCGSYNERINFFFCGGRQPL